MNYTPFDSYYYSRPVAYKSYYPKLQKEEILKENDPDTQEIIKLLTSRQIKFDNLGGLSRGIKFDDIELGKRKFNHHGSSLAAEYYIHQWKPTNDLAKEHSTGTHIVTKSYNNFINEVNRVLDVRSKKYW